jgi:hypothetical protein
VAQFEGPIIAVKNVNHQDSDRQSDDKKDYILCHVSFQSTGGTNIFMVNSLSAMDGHDRPLKNYRIDRGIRNTGG